MKTLYIHEESVHNMIAPREVVPILIDLFNPTSVLDIGCGTGTWLQAFKENGIKDVTGVDGSYIDYNKLVIDKNNFVEQDLTQPFNLNKKYSLVLCLEVAEHIPKSYADVLVNSLILHGDTILFSAAIPFQGGQNHVNEQWPSYWQNKFAKHGYYFHDVIRPLIWENEKVDWWYRQNIFLLTKKKSENKLENLIHPACLAQHAVASQNAQIHIQNITSGKLGVTFSFKILWKAIKSFIFKMFRL